MPKVLNSAFYLSVFPTNTKESCRTKDFIWSILERIFFFLFEVDIVMTVGAIINVLLLRHISDQEISRRFTQPVLHITMQTLSFAAGPCVKKAKNGCQYFGCKLRTVVCVNEDSDPSNSDFPRRSFFAILSSSIFFSSFAFGSILVREYLSSQ